MKIFTLFIFLICIYLSYERDSCDKKEPFRMDDDTCANFTEVCLKSEDKHCKTLLNSCEQCPNNKITMPYLLNIVKSIIDYHNSSKEELDKKFDNLKDEILKKDTLSNKVSINTILLALIFVIMIIVLTVWVLEIRFKFISRQRKYRNKDKKNYNEIKQSPNYNNPLDGKLSTFDTKFEDLNGKLSTFDSKFEDLNGKLSTFDSKFEDLNGKLSEICSKIFGEIESTSSHQTLQFQINGEPQLIEIQVQEHHNIVHVKKKVCKKWNRENENKYKVMKLKYNETSLDDNDYLLKHININNTIINCIFDQNIDKNEIILKLQGKNIIVPKCIQININTKISDLKTIISKNISISDLYISHNSIELDDKLLINNYNLSDEDSIIVVKKKEGELTIDSIFDESTSIIIEYSNLDTVKSLKSKAIDKLSNKPEELILFFNKKYFEEDVFLYIIDVDNVLPIKYCAILLIDNIIEITSGPNIISGACSDIYEGRNRETKKEIILKKYTFKESMKLSEEKNFLNELITFQTTRSHPRFVQLFGVFKKDDSWLISMEKLKEGSLKEFLIKTGKDLPETEISKWSKQILDGLNMLHKNQIIHRNLKPTNILMDRFVNVKLSSFGLSKYLQNCEEDLLLKGCFQSKVGTIRYMSPEMAKNEKYGIQTDVWSFGIIILEMAIGEEPYINMTETQAILQIANNSVKYKMNPKVSPELNAFINRCLKNASERATVKELLEDPFLKKKL